MNRYKKITTKNIEKIVSDINKQLENFRQEYEMDSCVGCAEMSVVCDEIEIEKEEDCFCLSFMYEDIETGHSFVFFDEEGVRGKGLYVLFDRNSVSFKYK